MNAAQRILLVEDDFEIADMLRLFFTSRGYVFFHAGDGEEALRLTPRVIPHAILMDISLPDIDGYALTARLRAGARTAHIPVLFASQWNDRDKRLAGLSLGADDYLGKPYDLQELLLRTQNSIARAARDYFTDLRTGLPAAFNARHRLTDARRDPKQAIIEITVEHVIAYRNAYGSVAGANVHRYVGQLLLDVVNRQGRLDDFIGYLDEDQFVIITGEPNSYPIAEELASRFNSEVRRYYSDDVADDEPMMRLICRLTVGADPSMLY